MYRYNSDFAENFTLKINQNSYIYLAEEPVVIDVDTERNVHSKGRLGGKQNENSVIPIK